MAYIEVRELKVRDTSGRVRTVKRYKVRYRDRAGHAHSETKARRADAERLKVKIERELDEGSWRDPKRGEVRLSPWAAEWITTRHDLRVTTRARLETTMKCQVLPRFGTTALVKITNGSVRAWVAEMLDAGLSPATVRKAVFALRQCLAAAIADGRLVVNPAQDVPLPSEKSKPVKFLSQGQVEQLIEEMPDRYKCLALVGAYAGLRWGEAAGLTRRNVDVLRSPNHGYQYGSRGSRPCHPRSRAQDAAVAAYGAGRAIGHAPGRGSPMPLRRSRLGCTGVHRPAGRTPSAVAVRPPGLAAGCGAGRSTGNHLSRIAAQFRSDPGGRRLQRPRGLRVGGSQQCGVHSNPLRRAVRGRLGRGG